jgi:hypothetical protein
MSTSAIVRIAIGAAVLAIVASAWLSARAKQRQRDLMLALSLSVGSDLVHKSGSQALTGVTPELEAALKEMHSSPARAVIQPGDDDPALGGGRAQARLVLTNEAGKTLTLRLRGESEPNSGLQKFRVLGYRKTEPGGPANPAPPGWLTFTLAKTPAYAHAMGSSESPDPRSQAAPSRQAGALDSETLPGEMAWHCSAGAFLHWASGSYALLRCRVIRHCSHSLVCGHAASRRARCCTAALVKGQFLSRRGSLYLPLGVHGRRRFPDLCHYRF